MRKFLLLIILAFATTHLHAWESKEHKRLGTESYTKACENLAEYQNSALYERLCGDGVMAKYYGLATALSGDHFITPEMFFQDPLFALNSVCIDSSACERLDERYQRALERYALWDWSRDVGFLIKAKELYRFIGLALNNGRHFMPNSKGAWEKQHTQALTDLLKIQQPALEIVGTVEFKQAFYTSAFADHFLHDSFASGHIGINRGETPANESNVYHNDMNEIGRLVVNGNDQYWYTFGDGYLDEAVALSESNVITAPENTYYSKDKGGENKVEKKDSPELTTHRNAFFGSVKTDDGHPALLRFSTVKNDKYGKSQPCIGKDDIPISLDSFSCRKEAYEHVLFTATISIQSFLQSVLSQGGLEMRPMVTDDIIKEFPAKYYTPTKSPRIYVNDERTDQSQGSFKELKHLLPGKTVKEYDFDKSLLLDIRYSFFNRMFDSSLQRSFKERSLFSFVYYPPEAERFSVRFDMGMSVEFVTKREFIEFGDFRYGLGAQYALFTESNRLFPISIIAGARRDDERDDEKYFAFGGFEVTIPVQNILEEVTGFDKFPGSLFANINYGKQYNRNGVANEDGPYLEVGWRFINIDFARIFKSE